MMLAGTELLVLVATPYLTELRHRLAEADSISAAKLLLDQGSTSRKTSMKALRAAGTCLWPG
jgi:hypothetical protein